MKINYQEQDAASPPLLARYKSKTPETYQECVNTWCWECKFNENLNNNPCKTMLKFEKILLNNTPVLFGLEAQGHIPTVEHMLNKDCSWDEIGKEINWIGDAVKEDYKEYLSRKSKTGTKILTELQIHDKIVELENENDEMLIEMRTCNKEDHELYEISIRKNGYIKQGLLIALGN